jgi:hypothetical protein
MKRLSLALVVVLLLLFAAEAAWQTNQRPHVRLAVDQNESDFLLDGFHAPESDQYGAYRWTTGTGQVRLIQPGAGHTPRLDFQVGPLPPESPVTAFTLRYGDGRTLRAATDGQQRQYALLLPPEALQSRTLSLALHSDTTVIPPDTRPIGLRVGDIRLTFLDTAVVWPTLPLLLVQAVLLALVVLLLHRLRVPPLPAVALLLAGALLLLLLYTTQLLLLYVYLVRLAVALAVLVALTYALLPLAERYAAWVAPPPLMRTLWGVALLACLLRLSGSLYPLFAAYDLDLNVGRLFKTLYGNLVVVGRSIEFRNHVTVYPPGPYVLLLPGLLLHIPPRLLVMGGIGIVDGFGALFIGALARMFGSSSRAAILSALLYAAIPIHMTALWFGLTAQIFGHMLMVPLTIALLVAMARNQRAAWVAAGVLLTVALLSHVGVAVVAVAWLGLAWVVGWVRRVLPMAVWLRLGAVLLVGGLISFAFIYSAVFLLKIAELTSISDKLQSDDAPPVAHWLIYRGFRIAFHEGGFWLLVPGLLLLWRRRLPPGAVELVGSWIGIVLLFLGVELLTALQVRYIYFLTPLACVGIGLVLDRLAQRGVFSRYAMWGFVVALFFQGSVEWYIATFEDVMMSVSSLLR